MANHLFPTIFESVDEHHFLKNWGHSDLRSQKYAEVAENSLRLIKNVSITKTWFFKLLQVARLMAYPETSNRHQNFSLALRRPQPQKNGIPTWQPQSTFSKKCFFCDMKQIQKVAFPENLRLLSLEVTEIQDLPPPDASPL